MFALHQKRKKNLFFKDAICRLFQTDFFHIFSLLHGANFIWKLFFVPPECNQLIFPSPSSLLQAQSWMSRVERIINFGFNCTCDDRSPTTDFLYFKLYPGHTWIQTMAIKFLGRSFWVVDGVQNINLLAIASKCWVIFVTLLFGVMWGTEW